MKISYLTANNQHQYLTTSGGWTHNYAKAKAWRGLARTLNGLKTMYHSHPTAFNLRDKNRFQIANGESQFLDLKRIKSNPVIVSYYLAQYFDSTLYILTKDNTWQKGEYVTNGFYLPRIFHNRFQVVDEISKELPINPTTLRIIDQESLSRQVKVNKKIFNFDISYPTNPNENDVKKAIMTLQQFLLQNNENYHQVQLNDETTTIDYLHIIELASLTDQQKINLIDRIKRNRQHRRQLKNNGKYYRAINASIDFNRLKDMLKESLNDNLHYNFRDPQVKQWIDDHHIRKDDFND